MENLPKVSLITIYYNRCAAVNDSINSLIKQTYSNLEIIIVDDFSTDSTFEELKKFEEADPRIELRRNNQNCGFTQSLINTINSVDSKYIAIHGAGDISSETRVEEQVRYLEENHDVGVLTTSLLNENEHLQIERKVIEITTADLLKTNFIVHGAVMFRLSDYIKSGGYRDFFIARQDKDLWYRMSLVTKIHFYPKKLYRLMKQDKSVTSILTSSPIPLLLSEFATFLIKERLELGHDSLDINKEQGALLFNPSRCNKHFFSIVKRNIFKRNYTVAIYCIDVLIKTNVSLLLLFCLNIIKKSLIIINNKKKKTT